MLHKVTRTRLFSVHKPCQPAGCQCQTRHGANEVTLFPVSAFLSPPCVCGSGTASALCSNMFTLCNIDCTCCKTLCEHMHVKKYLSLVTCLNGLQWLKVKLHTNCDVYVCSGCRGCFNCIFIAQFYQTVTLKSESSQSISDTLEQLEKYVTTSNKNRFHLERVGILSGLEVHKKNCVMRCFFSVLSRQGKKTSTGFAWCVTSFFCDKTEQTISYNP